MTGLRTQWAAGEPTFGGWLTIPTSGTAESVARVGFDYVCIDQQHGVIDYAAAVPMIQAILLGGGEPITRVPWNEPGIIGKMLDAGAMGVIVPMVNTATRPKLWCERAGMRRWRSQLRTNLVSLRSANYTNSGHGSP